MVFPISGPQLPDIVTPPANKLRTDAVSKVGPVVLNDLVSVDPRTAVNVAIPTSLADGAAQARNPLAQPGVMVTPGMDAGTAATLEGALLANAGVDGNEHGLPQDLARILSDVGSANKSTELVTQWPAVNLTTSADASENLPPQQALTQNFQKILQGLAGSPMFAASDLKQLLEPYLSQKVTGGLADLKLRDSAAQLLDKLGADNPAVKDSARLLLYGNLLWQEQIMPGVQARIKREDAWEKDPQNEGQIMRGSKISIEMDLPNTGSFKVVGLQFGDWLNVKLSPNPEFQNIFQDQLQDLSQRLEDQVAIPVNYTFAGKDEG
ncbi:hypothetical protein [Polynucleobacter corsicus]|uniref:hypothetical protein n=1 Tax=Polynucleobacter corsicus TaxID=2081042 RepID=UPI001BFE2297|nr:hypothetical protein [Polynucleobacter corsicus]QWE19309.1 hypothetical protein C2747_03525 [Polynucleobacter corsicus]